MLFDCSLIRALSVPHELKPGIGPDYGLTQRAGQYYPQKVDDMKGRWNIALFDGGAVIPGKRSGHSTLKAIVG